MTNSEINWNFEGYKKEAHFFLCGAFESFSFIYDFIKKTKEFPCLLKDNVIIDSVYGSPTCIWNGGRQLVNCYYSKEQLSTIHDAYADLGIKVRFVFTNSLLNEHDIYDRYGNLLMTMFQDLSPEVVVNSPLLEDYLRNKYPSASFISSTTKRLRNSEDQLKEFDHNYKYVCLDYDYNYNYSFLNSIHQADRDRVEILVNPTCPKGCEARLFHQKFTDERQLEFAYRGDPDKFEYVFNVCPLMKRSDIPLEKKGFTKEYLKGTNFIFPQDIDHYLDMGFFHFKIQGRDLAPHQIFAEIFPYLIKPKFYPTALSMMNFGIQNVK